MTICSIIKKKGTADSAKHNFQQFHFLSFKNYLALSMRHFVLNGLNFPFTFYTIP